MIPKFQVGSAINVHLLGRDRSIFQKVIVQKIFIPKGFYSNFFFILNSNFSDTQVYGSSSLGTVLFRRIIIPKIFIPNSLFSNSRYPERSLFSVKVVNTVLSIIQAEKAEQIRVAEPVQSSLTCTSCSAKTSKILTIQGRMPARYTGLDTD